MKVTQPSVGGICESLQGKDKGTPYVIVGILAGLFVLVADGKRKTLGRPKRKNLKHLYLSPKNAKEYGADFSDGNVDDCKIAYALKQYLRGKK
ncbi:MAG: hypothetical protein ACI4L9_03165 [Candidatus Coproplasma sp.]